MILDLPDELFDLVTHKILDNETWKGVLQFTLVCTRAHQSAHRCWFDKLRGRILMSGDYENGVDSIIHLVERNRDKSGAQTDAQVTRGHS